MQKGFLQSKQQAPVMGHSCNINIIKLGRISMVHGMIKMTMTERDHLRNIFRPKENPTYPICGFGACPAMYVKPPTESNQKWIRFSMTDVPDGSSLSFIAPWHMFMYA